MLVNCVKCDITVHLGGLKFSLIMKKDCCLKNSSHIMLILPTKLLCNSIFGANIPVGAI